jgi:hypothetical protein
MGEPEVGESRFFFEFKAVAQGDSLVLEACFCSMSRITGVPSRE